MNKKNSTGTIDGRSGMQGKDSSHRSSLLTLFHPQNTRSSDSIGTSRLFQSELNLFQGSLPRSSETSSSNITSTPIHRPNRDRRETVEHAVKAQNTELVQSVKAQDMRRSNEQSKHRRIPSNASSVVKRNSFCRVITTQADVTLSSSVTHSLQNPVVPQVSNTSFSSGESSSLSRRSSKQSLNTSHASHSSALAHRTNFCDTDNLQTTEPADKRTKTDFNKDNMVENNACHGGISPSNGDFSERPASSSSSSSSVHSRQNKPIPFIDEVEHEEVTYRESNVCI